MAEFDEPLLESTRTQTIDALRQHFASGTLDVDAFERRVEQAENANSTKALAIITADLPAVTSELETGLMPVENRQLSPAVPEHENIVAIFGEVERKGAWTVARHTRAVTVMGGGTIDLREAKLDDGVYELQVLCVMGSLDIIAPPWLRVENHTSAIFGGVDHQSGETPSAGGPTLRVKGFMLFGGVDIAHRLPGESKREARKRRRAEAKALKEARK